MITELCGHEDTASEQPEVWLSPSVLLKRKGQGSQSVSGQTAPE